MTAVVLSLRHWGCVTIVVVSLWFRRVMVMWLCHCGVGVVLLWCRIRCVVVCGHRRAAVVVWSWGRIVVRCRGCSWCKSFVVVVAGRGHDWSWSVVVGKGWHARACLHLSHGGGRLVGWAREKVGWRGLTATMIIVGVRRNL
jgi:hypothetical protein